MANYYTEVNVNVNFQTRFSQNGPAARKMMSKINATLEHSNILQLCFDNISTKSTTKNK